MTISQKRAISYKINHIKRENQVQYILTHGLAGDFYKSGYKSMSWYLKSKRVHIAI